MRALRGVYESGSCPIFSTNSTYNVWGLWGIVAQADGQQPFTGSQGNHNWALGTDPTGATVLLGGVGVWRGTGCGPSGPCAGFCWETDFPHEDQHAIVWGADGQVFDANDGGIFVSSDDGVTWDAEINRLGVANEVSVDVGQSAIYAAAWDVGGQYSTDNGNTWLGDHQSDPALSGVDGRQVLVDPGTYQNAFYCQDLAAGSASRLANIGGTGWADIDTTVGNDTEPCLMAKAAYGDLFTLANHRVYASSDLGDDWVICAGGFPAIPDALMVTNDATPTIYVGVQNYNTLFETDDINFPFQPTAVPTGWPTNDVIAGRPGVPSNGRVVALDRYNGDIYVVGSGTSEVVYTAPAASKGLTSTSWVALSGTAAYPTDLDGVAVDSSTGSVLLVGEGSSGNSIYRLNNPGVLDTTSPYHHWRPWVYGLPHGTNGQQPHGGQPVEDIKGQYENGIFYYYVATWGRGIWKREARGGDF